MEYRLFLFSFSINRFDSEGFRLAAFFCIGTAPDGAETFVTGQNFTQSKINLRKLLGNA